MELNEEKWNWIRNHEWNFYFGPYESEVRIAINRSVKRSEEENEFRLELGTSCKSLLRFVKSELIINILLAQMICWMLSSPPEICGKMCALCGHPIAICFTLQWIFWWYTINPSLRSTRNVILICDPLLMADFLVRLPFFIGFYFPFVHLCFILPITFCTFFVNFKKNCLIFCWSDERH